MAAPSMYGVIEYGEGNYAVSFEEKSLTLRDCFKLYQFRDLCIPTRYLRFAGQKRPQPNRIFGMWSFFT